MCMGAALAPVFMGASTAAGATAAATGFGLSQALQVAGLAANVAGPLIQGRQQRRAAEATAGALEQEAEQTSLLRALEEQRTRQKFATEIRRQSAQFARRGVSLDSPSALYLGQAAAEEMAFAAQSVRQTGMAEQTELSTNARLARLRGAQSAVMQRFSAVNNLLTAAPKVWPGLLA